LRRAQRLSGVPSLGRGVIGATRSDARAGPSFTLDDAPPTTVGGASPFLVGPSRFSPAGPFFGGRCGCPWLLRIARAPSRRRADRVPSGPPGVARALHRRGRGPQGRRSLAPTLPAPYCTALMRTGIIPSDRG